MKLFGLNLKEGDDCGKKRVDCGKKKMGKVFVEDSDEEIYDHSKPKLPPKDETTSKTVDAVVSEDSRTLPKEDSKICQMTSSVGGEKSYSKQCQPKLCPPKSEASGAAFEGKSREAQCTKDLGCRDFGMRQIPKKITTYTCVTHQRPTKMQMRAADSHYYYHRPCAENPNPSLPIIEGVAKKFGFGRGSIARFGYYLPSIMGWSAVGLVTGAYFSLYLIENGLPAH